MRTVQSVVEELGRENDGVAVSCSRVEFTTEAEAEAATRQFRESGIVAVGESGGPRVAVVYDKMLASVVARILIVCGGTILPNRRIAPHRA